MVPPYDRALIDECQNELKKLLAFSPQTAQVSRVLANFGIRFVIVQPIADSKIDGAAMWLDPQKPVIALSMRIDRIDSFWFTLFHELAHIRNEDASVDSRLTGEDAEFSGTKPPFERRADEEASQALIPLDMMISFIRRVSPMYSKERIIQFAHRFRVHPGIVLGQLQNRGEIKWSANREMLVKVREKVIPTAVVDGWGNSIS
jgi:HTH-type transcriptional regulator/antitoxin HigA